MAPRTTFNTISNPAFGEYKEKGSKFFAFVFPVLTETEIKEYIQKLRKDHHQAVHVCSAFRLGSDHKTYRSSDDGEPNNSAGPPILGQIIKHDLTNVLIAVVRYYGGVNLGVGGLINAYKTASENALLDAEISKELICENIEIHFSYNEMPQVMAFVKTHTHKILSQKFELTCELTCLIPIEKQKFITDLSKNIKIKITKHGIYR